MRARHAVIALALGGWNCANARDGATDSAAGSVPGSADQPRGSVARIDTTLASARGELELRADRSSYSSGESVRLTLVNPTSHSYTYNPCERQLERAAGGVWTQVPEQRMCAMIAHILQPFSHRDEATELPLGLQPGRYRVTIALSSEDLGAPSRSVGAISEEIGVR